MKPTVVSDENGNLFLVERQPVEAPVDLQLMIELWHAGPASRDVALEMADRNRVNARSGK